MLSTNITSLPVPDTDIQTVIANAENHCVGASNLCPRVTTHTMLWLCCYTVTLRSGKGATVLVVRDKIGQQVQQILR